MFNMARFDWAALVMALHSLPTFAHSNDEARTVKLVMFRVWPPAMSLGGVLILSVSALRTL